MKRIFYLNDELKKIPEEIEYKELDGDPQRKYPSLTANNIKAVHNYVVKNSSYASSQSDDFVRKYFEAHKGSVSLSEVITRIILIDTVDSTNLKSLLRKNYYIDIAKRIVENKLEEKIVEGKSIGESFKKVACVPIPKDKVKNKEEYNLFVFLSKYITRTREYSYGNNTCYSIMDGVVKDYLPVYEQHFRVIGNDDLADRLTTKSVNELHNSFNYDGYCSLLGDIIESIGDGINRTMLDHFLWFSFKKEAKDDK